MRQESLQDVALRWGVTRLWRFRTFQGRREVVQARRWRKSAGPSRPGRAARPVRSRVLVTKLGRFDFLSTSVAFVDVVSVPNLGSVGRDTFESPQLADGLPVGASTPLFDLAPLKAGVQFHVTLFGLLLGAAIDGARPVAGAGVVSGGGSAESVHSCGRTAPRAGLKPVLLKSSGSGWLPAQSFLSATR